MRQESGKGLPNDQGIVLQKEKETAASTSEDARRCEHKEPQMTVQRIVFGSVIHGEL